MAGAEKGVEGQVIFYNRFVTLEELVEFIGAADIYITPYQDAAQIVSGTLAYTLGAGKAIISTPYWYAEEMLGEERGTLVPFQDPPALAEAVINLLDNESQRHAMRKRAYLFGRSMIWSQVAQRYMESFETRPRGTPSFRAARLCGPNTRQAYGRTAAAQARSPAPHDGRDGDFTARIFHRSKLWRGLYDRRQRPGADGEHADAGTRQRRGV